MQIECHIFAFKKMISCTFLPPQCSHKYVYWSTYQVFFAGVASPAVSEVPRRLTNQLGMHISEYSDDLWEPWALTRTFFIPTEEWRNLWLWPGRKVEVNVILCRVMAQTTRAAIKCLGPNNIQNGYVSTFRILYRLYTNRTHTYLR